MSTTTTYDFGLTPAQEKHAQRLHRDSIVIDLAFQGPCAPEVFDDELAAEFADVARSGFGEDLFSFLPVKAARGELPLYRELFEASGVTTAIVGSTLGDRAAMFDEAVNLAQILRGLPWMRRVERADDIRAAHAAGERAIWGMCQFNRLQPGDLDLLDAGRALGIVHTADCAYNRMNAIGAGCTERHDAGLSNFGLDFVRRCNEVGVVVDTSHSGRQTTLDACRFSAHPVVATHATAAALYDCDRAKSDEELRAIADTGGIIGAVAVPFFLAAPSATPPSIELVLDHVDYIARLVGPAHVALATDYPLPYPLAFQQQILPAALAEIGFRGEHNVDVLTRLDGFHDYRDMVNFTRGLLARGYGDTAIAGILGENVLRVFEQVWG